MTDDEHGTPGPQGPQGVQGPAGPAGPAAPTPEPEPIPYGYRHIAAFIRNHPSIKKPSMFTVIVFTVIVFGAGFLHFSDAAATRKVQRDHNVSACTLRVLMSRLVASSDAAIKDPTTTPSARTRAKQSGKLYQFIYDGQITSPQNLNCNKLLAHLAAQKKANASAPTQ